MKNRILIAAFIVAMLCASLTSAAFMEPQPKPANTIEVIEERLERYERLNRNYVPPSQDEIIEERLKRLEWFERNRESLDSPGLTGRRTSPQEAYNIIHGPTDEQIMRRLKFDLEADRLRVKDALSTGANTSRNDYFIDANDKQWKVIRASPRIPITPSERDQLNELLPRLEKALREPKTKQTPGIWPISIVGILASVVILLRGRGDRWSNPPNFIL